MPRTGGTYALPDGYLAVTGQSILASQHNPPLQDIAVALTGSLARDGSSGMQAALPMGGFKVTGMADGVDPTDAATVGQSSTAAATAITTAPLKATPVDADTIPLVDSAAGSTMKRLTWANLKSLFQPVSAVLTAFSGIGTAVAGDIIYSPTAGTWGRKAKGTDGQFLSLASGLPAWVTIPSGSHLGEGQTWQVVTGSRSTGTAYRNTTSSPIEIAFTADRGVVQLSADNVTYIGNFRTVGDSAGSTTSIIIPVGWYYKMTSVVSLISWSELR